MPSPLMDQKPEIIKPQDGDLQEERPLYLRRNFRRFVVAAILSAFLIEVTGHTINEIWDPPFVSNLMTLLGVLILIQPALLFVVSVPEKPFLRLILISAGFCIASSVMLDITNNMKTLDNWIILGHDSILRAQFRWFSLVLGIFLLFSGLYWTVGDLLKSQNVLKAERQELIAEMRQRGIAEKKAEAAREYAENLIRTANVIVIGSDREGNLKVFNEAAERITGYTFGEIREKNWFEILMPPERYPRLRQAISLNFDETIPRQLEAPILTKSGEDRQIAWSNSPVYEGGKVTGAISFGIDITERKREEADLLRSSRLVTLGVISAGLAHEIGNPLASLSARLRLMEESGDPDFWKESIGLLQRQLTRISNIVHGVSRFSRPPSMDLGPCNVNSLIADTLDVIRFHKHARTCEIGMQLAEDMPQITARPDQLAQVFLNLALNALEAMPEGGRLSVSTSLLDQQILVAFSDTGKGLTGEEEKEMFNAFYTSKPDGMGLGLSIAQTIIVSHKGRITFENNSGGGATFRILLPVTTGISIGGLA